MSLADETAGEALFRKYLDRQGYAYERPDQGTHRKGKAADFRVLRDGRPVAIVEVKQWDEFQYPYPVSGTGTINPERLYAPIREKVRQAAPQLKAHKEEELPLIVALVNHKDYPIALDDFDVQCALHGDPAFKIEIEATRGTVVDGRFVFDRNGRLRSRAEDGAGQHAYISGVAIVRQRCYESDWIDRRRMIGFGQPPRSIQEAADVYVPFTEARARERRIAHVPPGHYICLDVFESYSVHTGEAVPIPRNVFDAPGDRRLGFSREGVPNQIRGRNVPRLFAEALAP